MIEFFRRIKAVLFYDRKNGRCGKCGKVIENPMHSYGLDLKADPDVIIVEYCKVCVLRDIYR